jgi:hypothetical protein
MIAMNELTSSLLCYGGIIKSFSRRKESERGGKLGKEIREKEGMKVGKREVKERNKGK